VRRTGIRGDPSTERHGAIEAEQSVHRRGQALPGGLRADTLCSRALEVEVQQALENLRVDEVEGPAVGGEDGGVEGAWAWSSQVGRWL
jgi:hypothetical protein